MYLLDTNVVSELRKAKPHGAVLAWLEALDTRDIYLSAMVLGEIQAGIEVTRDQDGEKAAEIEVWLSQISRTYQVLPLDGKICREWARLMHGRSRVLTEDALIGATAKVYGFTLATRNLRHFQDWDLQLFDPFTFAG